MQFIHQKTGTVIHMTDRCISQFARDDQITYNHLDAVINLIDDISKIENNIIVTGEDENAKFKSICVETPPISIYTETTFARRRYSTGPSRILSIKDHAPVETNKITVIVRNNKSKHRQYVIVGFYAGEYAPAEPWNRAAIAGAGLGGVQFITDNSQVTVDEASIKFWCSHALLVDPDEHDIYTSTWNEVVRQFYDENPSYF